MGLAARAGGRPGGRVTPLAARLVARIRANGPMSVADYMAACLGDPEHGYYTTREPFGQGGDFVTAPEVSQIFGELIGAWAIAVWETMGSPSPFILAELGPGRGTLMADMLRTARLRPAFTQAARIHLVEISPRLHAIQSAALAKTGFPIAWHERIEELPAGPTILIANEFFDAMPIRQFVKTAEGTAERMVGLDETGGLAFGLRPVEPPLPSSSGEAAGSGLRPARRQAARRPEGDGGGESAIREFSPAATAVMADVAARLAGHGGAALIIDYGYEGPAIGDTLQAVRRHRTDDPLVAPGEADLTAHVDFAALGRAAIEAGASARPLLTQGEFLRRLGIAERARALAAGKDDKTGGDIETAVERLTGEKAMGGLFKVLGLSAPDLALPAFDPPNS
jgi:SAM-dependent MidA family methyltransferase